MRRIRISLVMGTGVLAAACGDGGREDDASGGASFTTTLTTTVSSTDPTSGGTEDTLDSSDEIGKLDVQGADDSSGGTGEDCASLDVMSDVGLQPADILVVIDNSGSMDYEAGLVQNYMNQFSSQIFLANIDARVVVISSYPDDTGVCIDPPLGSGGCPAMDNNPPGFTHINDSVGSNDGLQKLISHHPDWAPVMRQTASKHVIIVTDDDSDMSAADFQTQWAALDPSYVPYKFHAIAATADPVLACLQQHQCCAISAAVGSVYMALTGATGGVFGDLCDQEFQPIFDAVAEQVISGSALACEFAIPEPPDGETFDPMQVNVEVIGDDGMAQQIGHVDGPAQCGGVTDGWYYDDPASPTTILLCPQTCDSIQTFTMASVSIGFGCATVPAG